MILEKLHWMEEELIGAAEKQFECLEEVCTRELGEVIDMIKDLEEAKYYHTITVAMETKKGDHLQEEDSRQESRSYKYIEAREMKKDKATQLRELEKYIQEMSQEIIDMISDASVEEKAYLEKKLTALGTKIGQMK